MEYHVRSVKNKAEDRTIYYIHPTILTLKNITMAQSLISTCISIEDCAVAVVTLRTLKEFQGRGMASHLLKFVASVHLGKGLTFMILDDMSDLARHPDNVYVKAGLRYEDVDGGPEMIGYLSVISV